MFAGLFCPVKVHAEETGSYLSELSDEMDYGKLDTFLENYGVEKVSFSGLVEELMQDGVSTAWGEHVFSAIKTSTCSGCKVTAKNPCSQSPCCGILYHTKR